MKLFHKIRPYILSTCVSFTAVILIQFSFFSDPYITYSRELVYLIFVICCLVSVAIFITDLLPYKNELQRTIVNILDVVLVVFLSQFTYTKITNNSQIPIVFTIENIICTFVYLLITYAIVYIFACIKNKTDEININKKIKERRK